MSDDGIERAMRQSERLVDKASAIAGDGFKDSRVTETFDALIAAVIGLTNAGRLMRLAIDAAHAPSTAPLTPEQPPADHGDGSGAGGREGGEGA